MKGVSTATRQATLSIHIRQALFLKRDDIADALLNEIARTLTIENPAFVKAEKAGRWTGGIDKFLKYYELRANDVGEKFLVIPRGFLLPCIGR